MIPKHCPDCDAELHFAGASCGDDDLECDCDEFWDCYKCGASFARSCGAHCGIWEGKRELPDGR